jgi:CelD/BcsL family acetyltransferase involved in cellulose biosynthesis
MNVVAIRALTADSRPNSRPVPAIDSRIAQVEVFDSMAEAEPHWRALQHGNCLAPPYQDFDFLNSWHRHVGAGAGITPFVVVAFNGAGTPLFVWPLGRRTVAGRQVVEFLGGSHANFNMAVWQRDAVAKIGADDLRAVLGHLSGQADILRLTNQPLTWAGTTNPLALLPQQASPNFGFSGALACDFDVLLRARTKASDRKKMRKKERTLAGYGDVRFERARGKQDVRRVLDAFFKQKSARMRALGIPDVFAAPGVRRFIEAAATEAATGFNPPIELYSLSVNNIIVATMGGTVGGGRFCAMFNSIAQGHYAIESPGEQLILNLVKDCCERGLTTFDLGIGEAQYKTLFCSDTEPLFDSYLPLTTSGHMLAIAFAAIASLKRAIKQRPMLWAIVRTGRRLRAWLSNFR